MLKQPDGKIVISSLDWELDGESGKGFIRLDTNGKRDRTFYFESEADAWIDKMYQQPDGKILLAFLRAPDYKIVRLMVDGRPDPSFSHPASVNLGIWPYGAFAIQPDGKMIYATDSTIGRLDRDGNVDNDFTPSRRFAFEISNFVFGPDGDILVCGGSLGWSTFINYRYAKGVKNGLYRLKNCMVVINQKMPEDGKEGVQYAANIYSVKPDTAIKISLSQGMIPPGLKLNTQTGEISGTPLAAGSYTFSLNATNGSCSDIYTYQMLVRSAVDTDIHSGIAVFPVPTKDFLQIRFGNSEAGSYDIGLYDVAGKLVLQDDLGVDKNQRIAQYDLRRFSAGIYLLKVQQGKKKFEMKVQRL